MQMKHTLIICLYYNKVITDFVKAFSLIYSNKMLEESINLNFEKKSCANQIIINKVIIYCLSDMKYETVQYLFSH